MITAIKTRIKEMLRKVGLTASPKRYDLSAKQIFRDLRVEINSDCNRSCSFCPITYDLSRKNKQEKMPTATVKSIIDQAVEMGFSGRVGFSFENEPTLDDRLFYFLDYANSKGLKTMMATNGDTLKADKDYTINLFNRVTTKVGISIYDYKDMKGREELIAQWLEYLRELNIPRDKVKFGGNYFRFPPRPNLKGKWECKDELDRVTPMEAACRKFLDKLNIRYDGEVPICCDDALVQCSMGNINDASLSEIWWGRRRMELAKLLAAGKREAIVPCNRCLRSAINIVTKEKMPYAVKRGPEE